MKRLRIGFDLDGVLADFERWYVGRAKQLWPGFEPKPEWDFGLTKAQQEVLWKEIRGTRNFWFSLYPMARIPVEAIDNHTLIFITSRIDLDEGPTVEAQSAEWLRWFFHIEYPTVLVVNHWHEKPELYRACRLDAFIDDKPETVSSMLRKGQNAYIYDQPWNREFNFPNRAKTITDYIKSVEATCGGN